MFSSNPGKKFFKAAAGGDLAAVTDCLEDEVDDGDYSIDAQDGKGKTALILAAEAGKTEIIKLLLKRGANLESSDSEGTTALFAATNNGCTEAVRILLAAGANANTHGKDFCAPLHWAAHNGDIDSAKALIAAGADINATVKSNLYTPLHYAIEANRVPVAEALINAGARTDLNNKNGATAFGLAEKTSPALAKLMEEVRKKGPVPAVVVSSGPSSASSAAAAPESGDTWALLGPAKIAHVGVYPQIGRKLTEIFNFESRERLVLSENLSTGAESIGAAEKFDTLSPDAVAAAAEALKQRGGNPERPLKVAFSL